MRIVVIADDVQQRELAVAGLKEGAEVVWVHSPEELAAQEGAEGYIDLLFEPEAGRLHILQGLLPRPVLVNSVLHTCAETDARLVRLAGWPTFLQSAIIEAACADDSLKAPAARLLEAFGKRVEWVPDSPGLVTPRVIASVINEAHFALEEGVSSREEINTAMRLGTNYPYGPFEWAERIGLDRVHALLRQLSRTNDRYRPAPSLTKAATQG